MEQNNFWKSCLKAFGLLLLSGLILGAGILALTVIPFNLEQILALALDMEILFLNVWPVLALTAAVYFLTDRLWLANAVSGGLFLILVEVNRFKITFRDDPFVFSDFLLIQEARKMTEQYSLFLDMATGGILIAFAVTVLLAWKLRPQLKTWKLRLSALAATIALFACTFTGLYFYNPSHNGMWDDAFGNQWKNGNQYMSRGFVYSFLNSIPSAISTPPQGYSEEAAEAILADYATTDLAEGEKVNIIAIMLEAYNDFSTFEGITFQQDPYANFHALQAESYYGKLYTNIFAADTTQTEWAFLNGYSEPAIRKRDTDSFVRYFASQGYVTEAMHPSYGWFYDRRNVNSYLGFQSFDYYENAYADVSDDQIEEPRYHELLSDWDFFDYIIDGHAEAVAAGTPYFQFSVTYQNHGPYSGSAEYDAPYIAWQEGYHDYGYVIVNNYLNLIHRTDAAIGKLHAYVAQSQAPTVLVLFGDHNPWLGEGNSAYHMLGISLDMDTAQGSANYYQTPYLIYANDAAKEALGADPKGEGETISPMFLMPELFDVLELEGGTEYLAYLQDIQETYPVINTAYVCKDGEYVPRSSLAGNEVLWELHYLSYYMKNRDIAYQ